MTYKSYVDPHMHESLAKHTLELHVETPNLTAYYLRPPKGGRMMSTYIVFTVEGIVIMGDLCPGQNGIVSRCRYGADWFGGALSEDYLCSKFLSTEWVPEKGYQALKEELLQARRDGAISKADAREAIDELCCVEPTELSSESAYTIFDRAGLVDFEIGYGYNTRDAGWLCAIQQRFAALYQASLRKVAA